MKSADLLNIFLKSHSVSTDTREITQGCIYFALKGENFNGNQFATDAIKKGAAIAIVDEKEYESVSENIFYVENALVQLQELAKAYRNTLTIPIIGITGSNGKTTTKELIASVLNQKFKILVTKGNLNNHIGVPLTLLSINPEHQIAVIEMGANHLKEIELLASISQPDLGYITNFGKAHLEGFGGVNGVIKAKSELYEYLRQNHKKAIINLDDKIQIKQSEGIEFISFGTKENADYSIKQLESSDEFLTVETLNTKIQSQLTGKYNFTNLACAISIGLYFDLSIQAIAKGIKNYIPENNRSQIILKNGIKVVMDAYNANPSSMEASLANFSHFIGNKTVILGDMFELGDEAEKEHQSITDLAEKLHFDLILLVGINFNLTKIRSKNSKQFQTKAELENYLNKNKLKTDAVLIKGSRGMQLEEIFDFI